MVFLLLQGQQNCLQLLCWKDTTQVVGRGVQEPYQPVYVPHCCLALKGAVADSALQVLHIWFYVFQQICHCGSIPCSLIQIHDFLRNLAEGCQSVCGFLVCDPANGVPEACICHSLQRCCRCLHCCRRAACGTARTAEKRTAEAHRGQHTGAQRQQRQENDVNNSLSNCSRPWAPLTTQP